MDRTSAEGLLGPTHHLQDERRELRAPPPPQHVGARVAQQAKGGSLRVLDGFHIGPAGRANPRQLLGSNAPRGIPGGFVELGSSPTTPAKRVYARTSTSFVGVVSVARLVSRQLPFFLGVRCQRPPTAGRVIPSDIWRQGQVSPLLICSHSLGAQCGAVRAEPPCLPL